MTNNPEYQIVQKILEIDSNASNAIAFLPTKVDPDVVVL
jgi:hypothetical protein